MCATFTNFEKAPHEKNPAICNDITSDFLTQSPKAWRATKMEKISGGIELTQGLIKTVPMAVRFKNLAAFFFCYHMLAIAAVNFPDGNVLHNTLLFPFGRYLALTGQLQSWDMFDSKPNDAKFEVEAFIVDANLQETQVGPLIPGLREMGPHLKLTSFFYRIHPGAEASAPFWNTYVANLCRDVQRARGPGRTTLWVDFISYQLRSLEQIRADGVLSEKSVATRGPVTCGN